MSKIRVHELAKELDKSNKELITFLGEKKIEVKSHMSTLEEDQVSLVKKAFTKTEEPKPKKKKITQVFNPQNSQNPALRNRNAGNRRPQAGQAAPGQRPAGPQARPQGQRPAGQPARPQAQSQQPRPAQQPATPGAAAQQPARPVQSQSVRPQGTPAGQQPAARPQGTTTGQQPTARPQGTPAAGQQARPQGQQQRPQGQQQRPAGQGQYNQNRPQGQGQRPQGQGQYNQNRPQGQGQRPQGQGQYNQNRPQGQGQRPQGQGQYGQNRPQGQGQRPQGQYGQNRPQGQRPQGQGQYGQNRPQGQYNQNRSGGYNNQNRNRNQGRPGELNISALENMGKIGTGPASQNGRNERKPAPPKDQRGSRFERKERPAPNQSKRPNQGGNRPNQRRRGGRGMKPIERPSHAPVVEKKDEIRNVILPESMTIKELADIIKVQSSVIVKKLFLEGTMVTVNQEIDYDMAEEIALEYNCIAEKEVKVNVIEELLKEEEEDEGALTARPPVVCVMGHVDHGKTSLLDAIRNTHVIDREAGGITQHIGAYVASISDQKITFLDTPGHEAFTAMRMRGANATDIAILVVAADDGVMPQTVEAINHAKAAGIEIIVAINKVDKPSANVERVKQELSEYELVPEDWGGSTIFVPVSAHTQEGIEQLLEMILLTAEVAELKANPKRAARGLVIEAELDKGKGPVATILVQKGTLRVGDPIAAGSCHGKVRAMMDDKGRRVKEAGPSIPVEILGLSDVPNAGEIFVAMDTEKEARSFAETFISEGREKLLEDTKAKMSLNDLFSQIQAGNLKELGIIVKADVQGSVEAVKQSLLKLSNEEVVVKIIHGGVGAINESDVILASTSNAIIIGFNVRPDTTAKSTAEQEGVDMRLYRVIYDAISDVESAMKGLLDPVFEEKVLGHAQIRQTFKASGVGTIAGSYVLDGVFQRGCSVRITRGGDQIFEGALASLKRFKDDVKEVKTGYECGLVFENFNDVQEDDVVEAYTMVEVPR